MDNKIVLITGSTDGIGKQTALELAKRNAYVLIHGRNPERCHQTVGEIAAKSGNNKLQPFVADLSSLKQVKKLAQQINQQYQHLDVLINNAGIYEKNYRESEDGLEMTFAVNHMAPFALTLLLLDIIKGVAPPTHSRSARSRSFRDVISKVCRKNKVSEGISKKSSRGRIINVSSMSHYNSPGIDFDDLNFKKNYDGYKAYCQSKLCNILFTYELAERLKETKITVNCLHPGVIDTKLLRSTLGMGGASLVEGAKTSVYLAAAPELEPVTGKYFSDCKESESSRYSHNIEARKKLWETSLKLTEPG
jgi:NAD(P)-dependent dehydrogenase (short-subunit alcohol dehydrogenase family)